eukprot:376382-Prymnesium_polylepis.3
MAERKNVVYVFEWCRYCLKYAKATAQAAKNCSFVSHLLPTIHYAHAKEYRLRLSAHAMNLVAKRRYQSVV